MKNVYLKDKGLFMKKSKKTKKSNFPSPTPLRFSKAERFDG